MRTKACGTIRVKEEFERLAVAAPSASWSEAAVKARYLIELFAATPGARNPRRREVIAKVLDDFARLSRLSESGDSVEQYGRPAHLRHCPGL
jgi:hypothetical protein